MPRLSGWGTLLSSCPGTGRVHVSQAGGMWAWPRSKEEGRQEGPETQHRVSAAGAREQREAT